MSVVSALAHVAALAASGWSIASVREGTSGHCYLAGPHTAVWNVDALAMSKEIILCEALFDAMTFWVAGFQNVITSYGVSGFTDAHRAALRLYGTERVLIAYDADAAGDTGAGHVADEVTRVGIECYRVHFPRGCLPITPLEKRRGAFVAPLFRMATGRSAPLNGRHAAHRSQFQGRRPRSAA